MKLIPSKMLDIPHTPFGFLATSSFYSFYHKPNLMLDTICMLLHPPVSLPLSVSFVTSRSLTPVILRVVVCLPTCLPACLGNESALCMIPMASPFFSFAVDDL